MVAVLFMLCQPYFAVSQTETETVTKPIISYSGGDIETFLQSKVTYPKTARKSDISGDVIFSFKIGITGKSHHLRVASSPSPVLTKAALDALTSTTHRWKGEEKRDTAQEYLHIFRFRILQEVETTDYSQRCAKQIGRQKWEKALKFNDLALAANQYDAAIWNQRAQILESLQTDGAEKAKDRAINFGRQVVSNIQISAKENTSAKSSGAQTPIEF